VRYALLSDVHANLPALDAVLADIERQGVDATYHLGDLVGYAPWANEVVQRLSAAGVAGIAGNYDSTVAADYEHCGCRYEDARHPASSFDVWNTMWSRRPARFWRAGSQATSPIICERAAPLP
jgi:predicted phosphodiesterase